jgi:hypothetical protein
VLDHHRRVAGLIANALTRISSPRVREALAALHTSLVKEIDRLDQEQRKAG